MFLYTPICHNHSFLPCQTDGVFAVWRDWGLAILGDLYINKQFASFNQLKAKFNIPNSNFFPRYLQIQIRHYVKDKIPNF